jgi:hypothetical protein
VNKDAPVSTSEDGTVSLKELEKMEVFKQRFTRELVGLVGYRRGIWGEKVLDWDRWMMIKNTKMSEILDPKITFARELRPSVGKLTKLAELKWVQYPENMTVEKFMELMTVENLKVHGVITNS